MIIELDGKHYCITSEIDMVKILLKAIKSGKQSCLDAATRPIVYSLDGVLALPEYTLTGKEKWIVDTDSFKPIKVKMLIKKDVGGVKTGGCFLHKHEITWLMHMPFDTKKEAANAAKNMMQARVSEISAEETDMKKEKALLERLIEET